MTLLAAAFVLAVQGQTPATAPVAAVSGPKVGESLQTFAADHVYGPLGNRSRDFLSTYPSGPKIVAWANEGEVEAIRTLAKELESQVKANRDVNLRALIVVIGEDRLRTSPKVRQLGYAQEARDVSFAVVEPADPSLAKNMVLPEARITLVVARGLNVTANLVPVDGTKIPLEDLRAAIKAAAHPESATRAATG